MSTPTLPERLPPIPETPAGRIVSAYLMRAAQRTPHLVARAAQCSRGLYGDVHAAQVIQLVSQATPAVRIEDIDENTMRAVLIAVSCWGSETRRTHFSTESGFSTLATALSHLRDRGKYPQAVTRSVNALARVAASNVQREVQRASSLVSSSIGTTYNHALLADDVYFILSRKNLHTTRMRFAVESGTGKLQREIPIKPQPSTTPTP